ncbi:MAG: monofunctional biosynthetic peptidoglycan transglycosylase [Bacteroidetes bacterium]|nr:monofunctional biosynthetic peptidoglycan transglycosylase [Bacteroidota bacterium]
MRGKRPTAWKHWTEVFLRVLLLLFQSALFFVILYRVAPVPITPLMLMRGLPIEKDWVPFDQINKNMVIAVITAEDPKFNRHLGFDFEAIQESIEKSISKGRKPKGRSTISQQTTKNIFFGTQRSWIRKGLEVPMTVCVETFWTKKRIMEVYLNIIEMGDHIYGIEAASQHYFKKPAVKLNKSEAVSIAVCLPNPRQRNPTKLDTKLLKMKATIMRWMIGFEPVPDWWWTNPTKIKTKNSAK